MTRKTKTTRAFGALRAVMRDHLYTVGGGGLIFTSPWVVTEPGTRCYATVLLTAHGMPFELHIGGRTERVAAVALRQMARRAVRAENVGLMSFQLDPSHPYFPRFRGIGPPGLLSLARALFTPFDAALDAAYRGALSATEAAQLFDAVVETVLAVLPPARPPDSRVQYAIELLRGNHNFALDALAAAVGLSYSRLSHVFVESMGLSLRKYQHWRKVHKAMTLFDADGGRSLTEIAHAAGFTDSSHMCKAFVRAHAAPPSHFLNQECVRIISLGRGARAGRQAATTPA